MKFPSRVGIGLAALGRPGYITLGHADDLGAQYDLNAMQAHTSAVLDAAWALGIRYFDVARSYGLAEQFLSRWIAAHGLASDVLIVGSKWGYTYTADWQTQAAVHEIKDHTLPTLERQWAESRALLGDYLKLYQIHSATLDSSVLDDRAVLTELAQIKQSGVAIGLTLSGAGQSDTLQRALAITIDGVRLFDSVQVTWNLLERSTTPMLIEAHAAGLSIIVKEVLANGLLTVRNHDPAYADQLAMLTAQADRLHTTPDALAIAAVLGQSWADVVLSGAATVDQVRSNLTALTVGWDAEAESALLELVEPPEVYWNRRKSLAWN